MQPARLTLAVVAVCMLLALLELGGFLLTQPTASLGLRSLVIGVLPAWLCFALAGSIYVRLSLGYRITPQSWRVRLPLHLLVALGLAVGVLALDAGLQSLDRGLPYRDGFAQLVRRYLVTAFVVMAGFVVLVHALLHRGFAQQQESARRELAARLQAAASEAGEGRLDAAFVFDALHRIEGMAVQGEQRAVADAIGAFGEVLRAGLEREPERMAALQRELLSELGSA